MIVQAACRLLLGVSLLLLLGASFLVLGAGHEQVVEAQPEETPSAFTFSGQILDEEGRVPPGVTTMAVALWWGDLNGPLGFMETSGMSGYGRWQIQTAETYHPAYYLILAPGPDYGILVAQPGPGGETYGDEQVQIRYVAPLPVLPDYGGNLFRVRVAPTPTPTFTDTPTPTASPTPSWTPTATHTPTAPPTPTLSLIHISEPTRPY